MEQTKVKKTRKGTLGCYYLIMLVREFESRRGEI